MSKSLYKDYFKILVRKDFCNKFHKNYNSNYKANALIKNSIMRFCEFVSKKHTKIFYFGNDDISLSPLETLYSIKKSETLNLISEINVITTPQASGNKTQTKFHQFLKEKEIPCTYVINNNWSDVIENINKSNNGYSKAGFICSFGKMIPSEIITKLELEENRGIYVLHPSLLPKYRGGAPIQHALLNNDKETGVSLIRTSKNKFDAGEVLMQNKVEIEKYFTFKELSVILSNECAKLLCKFIIEKEMVINNKELPILEENNKNFAKIITDKKYVYLDFINQNNEEILRIFRAFNGSQLAPFCRIKFGNHNKQIFFENLYESNKSLTEKMFSDKIVNDHTFTGCIYWDFKIDPKNIYIKSQNGWLISSLVKMEGLEALNVKDFVDKAFKNQKVNKQEKRMFVGVIDKKDVKF